MLHLCNYNVFLANQRAMSEAYVARIPFSVISLQKSYWFPRVMGDLFANNRN